jgi:hypothetical protein
MKEHKNILVAGILLVVIIIGMFVFAYLKRIEIEKGNDVVTPIVEDTSSVYGGITRIDAKHFYTAPTHTIAGEILMPTPCDLLNWETRILESAPEQVIVDFKVVNHAEVCTQVVTPQRFKVSFEAMENATIRATLQGREIEVNLIPAGQGESPDDFELFIKG